MSFPRCLTVYFVCLAVLASCEEPKPNACDGLTPTLPTFIIPDEFRSQVPLAPSIGDHYGAVAMRNGVMVLASPGSGNGFDTLVEVNILAEDGVWRHDALIMPPPADFFDTFCFGQAVATDGQRIAITSPCNGEGIVYVYENGAAGWTLTKSVLSPGRGGFGIKVAIDGNMLIVAAAESTLYYTGVIYAFDLEDRLSGDVELVYDLRFEEEDIAIGGDLGNSGGTVIIAMDQGDLTNSRRRVPIYEWIEGEFRDTEFNFVTELEPVEEPGYDTYMDSFGNHVAIAGPFAAVTGLPVRDKLNGGESPIVRDGLYIYEQDANGDWSPKQQFFFNDRENQARSDPAEVAVSESGYLVFHDGESVHLLQREEDCWVYVTKAVPSTVPEFKHHYLAVDGEYILMAQPNDMETPWLYRISHDPDDLPVEPSAKSMGKACADVVIPAT